VLTPGDDRCRESIDIPLKNSDDFLAMTAVKRTVEEEIIKSLEAHRDQLRGYRVYLFGSRARETNSPRSDFDLGVEGSRPLGLSTFFAVEESLERIPTLQQMDWVDLNRASKWLRENALREGRVLYEA